MAYEDITRQYVMAEGEDLSVNDLIALCMEDDKDLGYVNYLIFKRLHYLEHIINKSMKKSGLTFNPKKITEPEYYLIKWKDYYEGWKDFYINEVSRITGFLSIEMDELIEFIGKQKDWALLVYIYLNEEKDLQDFVDEHTYKLVERRNSLKDRKFFILR